LRSSKLCWADRSDLLLSFHSCWLRGADRRRSFRGAGHADLGCDGIISVKDIQDGKVLTEMIIVSVEGGESLTVSMIRNLAGAAERERAKMGLLITLTEPTHPMTKEAVGAGFFEAANGKYRKIQIVTIADLLEGRKPDLPPLDPAAFLKAPREEALQLSLSKR
jgi:hypothetical protein